MIKQTRPYVTVIMPIRNEVAFIEHSLGAVLAQDYPMESMEVIVADGMSDDGSRDLVRKLAANRTNVRLIDNPERIAPTALNRALLIAKGEVIIRVDGHSEVPSDYVSSCVRILDATGAECVGGPWRTVGDTKVTQSIALAQSSPFGVGGVAFRTGRKQGQFVDTLAFGAYRRDVFELIGNFDEELVRDQDEEFNFRLLQAGGKIWLDPSIWSVYYSRANLRSLWRQYFQYGFYKVRVIQKRRKVLSWRHLVPAVFVLSLAVSVLLALLTGRRRWLLSVSGPYIVANLGASIWVTRKKPRFFRFLPIAFATLHLAYGLGFIWGLWHWRYHWHLGDQ